MRLLDVATAMPKLRTWSFSANPLAKAICLADNECEVWFVFKREGSLLENLYDTEDGEEELI